MILSLVSVVLVCMLMGSTVAQDCTVLPTIVELTTELGTRVASDGGGEGPGAVLSDVGGPYWACQAQGSSKGIYRELSVIMTYTATVGADVTPDNVKQFELDCTGGVWASRGDSLSAVDAALLDYANIAPMTACSSCIDTAANDHHCEACDATCISGLMSCTGATDADCCLAFDDDGTCLATTTSCTKAGFISTVQNNWECACGQQCGVGEAPNAACDGCDVADICLATTPCMNGAPCTPDVDNPANTYTCACVNSYTGDTCSVCGHNCTAGHTFNAACDGCDLTSICEANEPCKNGGVCSLNGAANLYTCDCTGTNYMGTNCEVCSLSCLAGYEADSTCTDCILSDICVADNPCENDGNCTLVLKPNNYTCSCVNEFTSSSNCSECGLSCSPGYTNNTNCDKCVLSDICEADTPCQNGGTCELGSAPDEFNCACINSFTPNSNCTICILTCGDGYIPDDDCNMCKLNDTCIAHTPCQNGGTCQLGSTPSDFTCTCTNSFDEASNCSTCPLACSPGNGYDTDCTGCYLTDICLASNPCVNGATCVSGSTPTDYTCTCANLYTGTNCTDCPLTCDVGYKADSICSECILEDKCLADTPCKNGGTCDLITPPDQYRCQCINLFDEETDCDVCLKSCEPGYSPDSVCSDECFLTSICDAVSPCKNGGECNLGLTPDKYQCDCDKSFFMGTNCTDCNEICRIGYNLNINTCICDLVDICEADAPCKNGATCSLVNSVPDQYQCECRNQFGDDNCATCMLECNNGVPDSDCKSCDCEVGYTGEDCTTIDNCARSNNCSGRGDCVNHDIYFVCNCHTGATGTKCEDCVEGYILSRTSGDNSCVTAEEVSSGEDFLWWYVALPIVAFIIFILVNSFVMFLCITMKDSRPAKHTTA